MPVNDNLTPTNSLLDAARAYVGLGLSVIPLSPNSKVAAVSWADYQRRQPTDAELVTWFETSGHTGIGVVTGVVSGRLVLDFDDLQLYETFRQQYPGLAKTYTVQTRRGVHLYYRVPERMSVESRRVSGLDVQFEGRYVVAPPTTIDNYTYTPHLCHPEQWLTPQTKRHLTAFLGRCTPNTVPSRTTPSQAPTPTPETPDTPTESTWQQLIKRYQYLADNIGRNNALFSTAVYARDRGWSENDTLRTLIVAHIHQPAPAGHPPESTLSREREARRTVASAYTRPPRPPVSDEPQSYLPNTIREYLCQKDLTAANRVLEALHLAGFRPGDVMTTKQIKQACTAHGVGDWSVRKTLNAEISPLAHPQRLSTASQSVKRGQKHAVLDSVSKPTKNTRGRPGHHYRMPSVKTLARKFNLRISGADPIRAADLRSVRAYRSALHGRHIDRCPGQYSRKLLAERLNVSFQTIRRYDIAENVQKMPMFNRTPLYFHNVRRLVPSDTGDITPGAFLQDERGKRYPVKYELARRLIGQGHVSLVVQEPNFYWVGDSMPVLPDRYRMAFARPPDPVPARTGTDDNRLYPLPDNNPAPVLKRDPAPQVGVQTIPQHDPDWQRQNQLKRDEGPLSAERIDYWAEQIYAAVNERVRGESDDKRVSRETARRLVTTYGVPAVKHALWILDQRENIEAPAGFLITVLRSNR